TLHLWRELRRWPPADPRRVLATEGSTAVRPLLTYGAARTAADAVGQGLLDLGASRDRPVMVLSGNSLQHLIVTLACYTVGVPAVPASTSYSLMSTDHGQLRAMASLIGPVVVFAEDADAYGPALDAVGGDVVVVGRGARPGAIAFDALRSRDPTDAVEAAYAGVGPDTVAKVLFTSGSTGAPKGVLTTQRMLTSNQQMMREVWPFLAAEPPVLVDWLPWSHTFGGSHNLHLALTNGGTIHIDGGRPVPTLFERTVSTLRQIAPTVYVNVPAGYAMLVPRLEADPGFARHFFSRLRLLFYAAAALPPSLWDRLEALVLAHAPGPVPLTSSWGTTETAPAATSAHWAGSQCGCIGVPLPGVTLKLVPSGDKQEIRLIGPNVTPGYLDRPDATAAAFDNEGFYRTGDAVRAVDPDDPGQGLMFDGRIAEDFKLMTGTWVSVAALRTALLSAAHGVLQDAVIAGHDQAEVTALAWLNVVEAERLDVPVASHLASALSAVNAGAGSAGRVSRLLVCDDPPNLDAGEITDKGYLNQRVVLERRGDWWGGSTPNRPTPRSSRRPDRPGTGGGQSALPLGETIALSRPAPEEAPPHAPGLRLQRVRRTGEPRAARPAHDPRRAVAAVVRGEQLRDRRCQLRPPGLAAARRRRAATCRTRLGRSPTPGTRSGTEHRAALSG
ncbi:MAG: AMP-binding protein, partial [Geodermatophilaceae bacterium]